MDIPSKVSVFNKTLEFKCKPGTLIAINDLGFYEIVMEVQQRNHTVLFPINETTVIFNEALPTISADFEVERWHLLNLFRFPLHRGTGPFAVQPGDAFDEVVNRLGEPEMSVQDLTVENLSPDPENWLRAVFWIMVPVESRLFSRTSINLRIQHRRDTGVVWAIGIADGSGSFQKKIGKLSPADNITDAVTTLGEPVGGRQTAPIVDEYFWLAEDLAYFARFLTEANADFTGRMREKGTQINLEVVAVNHAPRGYVDARAEAPT